MIEIQLDTEKNEWDGYVIKKHSGIFSHLYSWGETLASTYGLEIFRLAAREKGLQSQIVGVLPLILFSPPGSDKRLISLPYSDAAGILADDEDIFNRLVVAALELATNLSAVHLELRQLGNRYFPNMAPSIMDGVNHTPHTFKIGLSRKLSPSSEMVWSQLNAKVRNQVRKARKSGCSAKIGGSDLLEDFYSVFSENMRDLGSPVHKAELFNKVTEKMAAQVFVIYTQNTPSAAAIVLRHNSTLFNPWASSLQRFRPLCPNMLLYWTMLSYAAEKGYRCFDFGRSTPGASTCRFKTQWGAEIQPLVWHVFSQKPHRWEPKNESLVNDSWKALDLNASRRHGPLVRQWISL